MNRLQFFSRRPPDPSTPEETAEAKRRTLGISITEGSIWSIMAGFGDVYVAPFAVFLKASNQAMAFLSTMPVLLAALSQLVGAALTERFKRRRDLIVPCSVVQALCYLPLFFMPALFRDMALPSVIFFTAAGLIFGNLAAPAWISLMGDIVPRERRGEYFGRRGRVVILMVFVSTLAAGGLLSLFQGRGMVWVGFGLLFAIACVARLVSARLLYLHYDPVYKPSSSAYFSFWDFIRRLPASNFAKFALFVALMMGAINIASPFFAVYMLRDLHWSYAMFTVNNASFFVTQFLLIGWWGRIGDRHGNRVVLVATSLILALLPMLWTFSTHFVYLCMVQVLAGVSWSGFTLATQNFTFDAVTPDKRARIAAYTALLNGAFALLGGVILGAWLANHLPAVWRLGSHRAVFASGLPGVFLASTLARCLAALLLLPRFKEVREAERIHPLALLLRLSGGVFLAGFIEDLAQRLYSSIGRRRRP